ncbi:MAG: uroporphyrinogen decarboxylase family protein [Anaerolineae bacterium]
MASPISLRERLLTTLRGGVPDRIPWNIYASLLPKTAAGAEMHRRGLGLMGGCKLYRRIVREVDVHEERTVVDGLTHLHSEIATPVGTLTQEAVIEPHHGSRWIKKFFITGPEDYGPAEFHFRHTTFEPDYTPWPEKDAAIGEGGIVANEIMPLPILELMQYWMGLEGVAEGVYVHTERFESLLDALNAHYMRQAELAAGSPAELIWFPESLTAVTMPPKLFDRYCLPLYDQAVPLVRGAGKLITAHYDGSIKPLLERLARIDIPIIEAFTPPPMGDVTVGEAQAAWPDKTVWVNVPGNLFLETAEAIEAYMLDLLRGAVATGHLVIGCTEDYPAHTFEKTFGAVGRALAVHQGYEW